MEKEIKIGETTFNLVMPKIEDLTVEKMLKDWCKIIEDCSKDCDVWSVITALPQYRFKNLRIDNSSFDSTEDNSEISINFIYDKYEKED